MHNKLIIYYNYYAGVTVSVHSTLTYNYTNRHSKTVTL